MPEHGVTDLVWVCSTGSVRVTGLGVRDCQWGEPPSPTFSNSPDPCAMLHRNMQTAMFCLLAPDKPVIA